MTMQSLPEHGAMVAAISATYARASSKDIADGRAWYPSVMARCHAMADDLVPPGTVAAVISALSPRCQWAVNLRWAEATIAAFRAGESDPPAVNFPANRAKAWSALTLGPDVIRAPKTSSFVANIRGDTDAVTVDVWAMRAAGIERDSLSPLQYARIVSAYREVAATVGETPRDLQAITWCVIRGGGA
jgi:hypothetical protein